VAFKVVFRPRAAEALDQLYTYISERGGADVALGYVLKIEEQCARLAEMPERAPVRPEVGPGVRVLSFRRRVSIAYRITGKVVEILGVFYGGRFMEGAIDDESTSS
jgi:toxin ParE1/3/4